MVFFFGLSTSAQIENLIRVKDKNGRDSSLLEKVVVVSDRAILAKTSNGQGEPIEPWSIFFRIKNEDGNSQSLNGRLRVGDAEGNPIGWIDEKDLKKWNTRFILDPIDPQPQRKFVVNVEGGGRAEQQAAPEGKKRYALIIDPPSSEKGDDTLYPVIVYAGNVQGVGDAGTLAKQRNELSDVKLEIVFAIETNELMSAKFSTEKSLLQHVQLGIKEAVNTLQKDDKIKTAVRFGLVDYKDSVAGSSYTSRVQCDLTDNLDLFLKKVDDLSSSKVEMDDWPADVLSGLNTAAQSTSWSENSVKHVVVLGIGSCQLANKGVFVPESGRNSGLEEIIAQFNIRKKGYNSTGMTISQLISRARPQGGSSSRSRSAKMFHALHFGHDIDADLKKRMSAEDWNSFKDLTNKVNSLSKEEFARLDEDSIKLFALVYVLSAYENTRNLALTQFREISQNNHEIDGIYQAVEPDENSRRQAILALATKVIDTFKILEKVRDGDGLDMKSNNELAQPLFTLVGAAAEKFKNQKVIPGTAATRDERGREVAFKKVMVSEAELNRLHSTLDALFTTFKGKSSKSDRQDVGQILENMKAIVASTTAGQKVTADAKLKELISDLPLRSAALDTSASDLALMTTEAFTEWLERIESAKFRIEDLLKSQQDWLVLSDRAVNDKFTFLKLSELP